MNPSFASLRQRVAGALFLSLALIFTASAPAQEAAPAELRVVRDAAYKTGGALSDYEKERCKLDVYAPADAKDAPCLVWFHGGALQEGRKDDKYTAATCRALAGDGLVVAAVNYRLSPKVKYPAYIEDAAAAVAWMREHAAEYGGSPRRVFVAGHSAGGYLAAMVAMDSRYLQKYGFAPEELAGVIPLSGQMVTHYTIREERGLPKTRIIVDEAAPIYYARKDTPPLLVLYADHDMTLRGDENRYFTAALTAAGNRKVTLREIVGHDHSGMGNRISEPHDAVREAILGFIRETR